MKKNAARILACFMACLIAFNAYAIPKAEAVSVGEVAGFTSAVLTSFMHVSGLSMAASTASAASAAGASVISGYAAATGTTSAAVSSSIAAGAAISTSGAIILGVGAVALLAAIVAWAVSEYGFSSEPTEIYSGAFYVTMRDGNTYPIFEAVYDSSEREWHAPSSILKVDAGATMPYTTYPSGAYWSLSGKSDTYRIRFYLPGGSGADSYVDYNYNFIVDVGSVVLGYMDASSGVYPVLFVYDSNGEYITTLTQTYHTMEEAFGVDVVTPVSVTAPGVIDYPDVSEDEQLVIDVGAGYGAGENRITDTVFGSVVGGTLNPSLDYTQDYPDLNTGTDTDADSMVSLGLLQRIALGVESLTDGIVSGIAKIFAPDQALMTEISDTFNSKFGFVSTLHRLGTDLLSIDASSEPPVVYIHLEDAEGSIDYGGTVKALDMAWYARYKEDGDRIMSGFLWLGFLWLLFKRAPAIINGGEMVAEYGSDLEDGKRRRRR